MIIKKHETIESGKIINKKVRSLVVLYEDGSYEQLNNSKTFIDRYKEQGDSKRVKRVITEEENGDPFPVPKKTAEDPTIIVIYGKEYRIKSEKHRNFFRDYYDLRKNPTKTMLKHGISGMQLYNLINNYKLPQRKKNGAYAGKSTKKEYKIIQRDVAPQKRNVKAGERYSVERTRTQRTNIKGDPAKVKKLIADFQDHSQKTPDICTKWDISPGQLYTILRANNIPTRNATIKVPVKKGKNKK